MKNKTKKPKNVELQINYLGDKLLDHYSNISTFVRMEYSILSHYDIKFPFYYKEEIQKIDINPSTPIDEQVYKYLNDNLDKYHDVDNLIVKLNCEYNKAELELKIFSVYKMKKKKLKECGDFIDYLNICLYTNNLPSALFYLNENNVWNDFNYTNKVFLILLPVLNSGIFKYSDIVDESGSVDIVVNEVPQWKKVKEIKSGFKRKNVFSDISPEQKENEVYDMLIRSVYNL